ncbi:MAG: hypothetical protein V1840_02980 [Candidatus Omnitrophota bacterium]
MKRPIAPIIAITLCFAWGVFLISPSGLGWAENTVVADVPQDLKITAVSGGIAPGSPHYKIEIDAKGNGSYWEIPEDSTADSVFIEKGRFIVKGAALRFIYGVIKDTDFFSLKEEYIAEDVLDGSYAQLTITADKKTKTVRTRNQAVKAFDRIMLAINVATPPNNKVVYNEILK